MYLTHVYERKRSPMRLSVNSYRKDSIIVVPCKHYTTMRMWARLYDMEEEIVANWTLKTINRQLSRLDTKAWPLTHPNAALTEFPMTPDHTLNDISGFGGA